jgi:hypothetical protein
MQLTKKIAKAWGLLLLILLCLAYSNCRAEAASVREILSSSGKYRDQQIQLQGRVERWVDSGGAQKAGRFVLRDNFGDEIEIKTTGTLPPVGENLSVQGVVLLDAEKKEYYLQSLDSAPPAGTGQGAAGKPALLAALLGGVSGASGKLIALASVACAVFLLIVSTAVRVNRKRKKEVDIPDFSFDETETIKIDAQGQFFGSGASVGAADEATVVLLPGLFKITKGPDALAGQSYRMDAALTKLGREESGVDKSTGWISFPPSCVTVSRHQADLVFQGGSYYLESKSRVNLTLVNGVPVNCGEPCQLNNNDVIAFSGIELTYNQ